MRDRGENRKLQNAEIKKFKGPCKIHFDGSGKDQQRSANILEEKADMLENKRGGSSHFRSNSKLLIPKLGDMLYLYL